MGGLVRDQVLLQLPGPESIAITKRFATGPPQKAHGRKARQAGIFSAGEPPPDAGSAAFGCRCPPQPLRGLMPKMEAEDAVNQNLLTDRS